MQSIEGDLEVAVATSGDATARKLLKAVEEFHTYIDEQCRFHSELWRALSPRRAHQHRLCRIDGEPGDQQADGEKTTDAMEPARRPSPAADSHARVERRVGGDVPHVVSGLPVPHASLWRPEPHGWAPPQSDSTIDHDRAPRAGCACSGLSALLGCNPTEQLYCRTHEAPPGRHATARDHLPHPGRGAPAVCGHHRQARPRPLSAGLSSRAAGLRSVAAPTRGCPREARPHLHPAGQRLHRQNLSPATGGPAAPPGVSADPRG